MGLRLEDLLKSFYEKHFNEAFGYKGFPLTMPSEDVDWIAKCRTILPEFDSIAKQYNLYVEYDEINPQILRLSKPVLMTDIKSLAAVRYCYIKESPQELMFPMFCLFNPGALLHVVGSFKDAHYTSFYQLLSKENVSYHLYDNNYRKQKIDKLINLGYIKIDANGYLRLCKKSETEALFYLWRNNVISYWNQSKEVRSVLDQWIASGWLSTDDHLLCKQERDLFDYYLNNSKFTNGPAIRNQYAHGCIPVSDNDNEHVANYYTMLMLLVSLLLKMEDDFRFASRIIEENIRNSTCTTTSES